VWVPLPHDKCEDFLEPLSYYIYTLHHVPNYNLIIRYVCSFTIIIPFTFAGHKP
jgi:hypothetical protein